MQSLIVFILVVLKRVEQDTTSDPLMWTKS